MTINQEQKIENNNNILSSLFGSETRSKILKILILNSKKSLKLSELSKQTGMDISGVHREISNLLSLGIITSNKESKNPEYKINGSHILFHGLLEIFNKADSLSKKYFLFEEMPIAYPSIAVDYLNVHVSNEFLKLRGLKSRISKTLAVYQYPNLKFYFYRDEFKKINNETLDKLKQDPEFGINDAKDAIIQSNRLLKLADEIEEENYTNSSDKEILELLKKYQKIYEEVHIRGWLGNASDMPDMIFTKHLLFILKEKIRKKGSLLNPQNAYSKLTTPSQESFMQKEHENLLKIFAEINKNKELKNIFKSLEPRHISTRIKNKPIYKKLEKHTHDYGWISYGFIGPSWDDTYFIGIISSLIRQNQDPIKMLEEIKQNKEDLIKEQEKIIKSLDLGIKEQKLFEVARGFIFTKGYRKDAMFKFFSRLELFFKEIARRLHISITNIRFCYPHEFNKLISRDLDFLKDLQEREKFSICESTRKYEDDLYLSGEQAKKYVKKLPFEKEESTQVTSLEGTCACPGRIKGKVKIINIPKEMDKMEKGDILISLATSPDLVPAMKKAAAIVTDMGGITSHAAIVSRELNIPCVVGTKIATKALKDSMLVDVDATHGTVKILKKA